MRRRIWWATAWLAGAVVAAVVIAVTVSQLGTDLFGGGTKVLSQAEVNQQLSKAKADADQAQPQPSSPAHSRGQGRQAGRQSPVTHSWSYPAGMVHAACQGSLATLTALANPGFQLNGLVSGPATTVSVRFESASSHSEQTVTVTCPNGAPVVHTSTAGNDTGDDHGGGGGGGGGGGPGGGHGGGDG